MVFIAPFIAAALSFGFASALPRPDSSINEPAVSAPNGIPITDTSGVASKTAISTQASSTAGMYQKNSGSSDNSGSQYGSGSSWMSSSTKKDTATSATPVASSTPSYGSGTSNWGNSGYNDCVQQCVASHGAVPAPYQATATSNSGGSSGTGATHTVIVAPTQGVLRYIPFAVNASVGDTVKFMWGANNHTVTKSSSLLPCNRSADALFTSGSHDKDFVFTQIVNDTNPTFFYCATPNHCQKGMFGIINPPSALGSATSVSGMMQSLSANSPNVAAFVADSSKQTANNVAASKWGGNIDMAALPEWSHQYVAENVLYTRNFLAANAEVLKESGAVDLSAAGTTPLMIPQDLSAALINAAPSPATAAPPTNTEAAAQTASTSATTGVASSGGVSISPRFTIGVSVVLAMVFLL
ncbi:uncharacterized protein LACBIDRAFT_322158 [Laccaria bicolor S238N-H82]|uniref:Predicted protein n=1 Tax=Laccaria bicolor (strain S238N-H82 / ATCC MYA-4686) TaxID=486041 RepID=B0CSB6_LACBS|nr:uncharacterized protein LACBIDRAFT_322158 [Laccaria bicolor S238N-H82]EDR14817.1 predicted protein [Laccaria bicolor S238N-H82]|eukprot:XP_001875376.1 predicted protein [Laccaria bicolor S238N-H82]